MIHSFIVVVALIVVPCICRTMHSHSNHLYIKFKYVVDANAYQKPGTALCINVSFLHGLSTFLKRNMSLYTTNTNAWFYVYAWSMLMHRVEYQFSRFWDFPFLIAWRSSNCFPMGFPLIPSNILSIAFYKYEHFMRWWCDYRKGITPFASFYWILKLILWFLNRKSLEHSLNSNTNKINDRKSICVFRTRPSIRSVYSIFEFNWQNSIWESDFSSYWWSEYKTQNNERISKKFTWHKRIWICWNGL